MLVAVGSHGGHFLSFYLLFLDGLPTTRPSTGSRSFRTGSAMQEQPSLNRARLPISLYTDRFFHDHALFAYNQTLPPFQKKPDIFRTTSPAPPILNR
jgi:hypothetical protein